MSKRHKQEPKTEPEQDIEEYVQSEKMKHDINFLKDCERKDFFIRGNFPNG